MRVLYCFSLPAAIPTSMQQQSPIHALEGLGVGKGKDLLMAPPPKLPVVQRPCATTRLGQWILVPPMHQESGVLLPSLLGL